MRLWWRKPVKVPPWTSVDDLEFRMRASRERMDALLELRAPQILLDNELDIQRRLRYRLAMAQQAVKT